VDRLRVHRSNARFCYQPGTSHRSSIGPAEFQLIPRCTPPPNRNTFYAKAFQSTRLINAHSSAAPPRKAASFNRFLRAIHRRTLARVRLRCWGPRKEISALHAKISRRNIHKKPGSAVFVLKLTPATHFRGSLPYIFGGLLPPPLLLLRAVLRGVMSCSPERPGTDRGCSARPLSTKVCFL
jgi:hypothetical protein